MITVGFREQGLGIRVQGLRFRDQGLGLSDSYCIMQDIFHHWVFPASQNVSFTKCYVPLFGRWPLLCLDVETGLIGIDVSLNLWQLCQFFSACVTADKLQENS